MSPPCCTWYRWNGGSHSDGRRAAPGTGEMLAPQSGPTATRRLPGAGQAAGNGRHAAARRASTTVNYTSATATTKAESIETSTQCHAPYSHLSHNDAETLTIETCATKTLTIETCATETHATETPTKTATSTSTSGNGRPPTKSGQLENWMGYREAKGGERTPALSAVVEVLVSGAASQKMSWPL